MSSLTTTVDLFDYVIFGGGGDLAERKLLPALFHRDRDNNLPDAARIVGVSRTARTDDDYREFARKALQTHVTPADLSSNVLERFLSRLSYISVDATVLETDIATVRWLVDYKHSDSYYQYPYSRTVNPLRGQNANVGKPSTTNLVNTRINISDIPLGPGTAELSFWMDNVFDQSYRASAINFGPSFGGLAIEYYGRPRSYGLNLKYEF